MLYAISHESCKSCRENMKRSLSDISEMTCLLAVISDFFTISIEVNTIESKKSYDVSET